MSNVIKVSIGGEKSGGREKQKKKKTSRAMRSAAA